MGTKHNILRDNHDTLISLLKDNKSCAEIADFFGIHTSTLKAYRDKHGLSKPRRKDYKDIGKDVLEELYIKQRKGMCKIAEELEVSSLTIQIRLKDYNIPIRTKRSSRVHSKSNIEDQINAMHKEYNNGT